MDPKDFLDVADELIAPRVFPQEIQDFAWIFCMMQRERHEADYDPTKRFYLDDVFWSIRMAEYAIADFLAVDTKDRRAFAVYLLLDSRAT